MKRNITNKTSGTINTGLNLYELNQQIYANKPPLTSEQKQECAKDIKQWFTEQHTQTFALVGYDFHYFTVFLESIDENNADFSSNVMECLDSIGAIKDYEIKPDGIEFWICPKEKEETYIFILFNYEQGVVYYH